MVFSEFDYVIVKEGIYFDDGERATKGREARLSPTHTHADTYIPGGNKRKTKKRMRRGTRSQGNDSKMYDSGMCA